MRFTPPPPSQPRAPPTAPAKAVEPVPHLDFRKYVGLWRQTYASLQPLLTYEVGGRAVTAVYGQTNRSDVLSVRNTTKPRVFLGRSLGVSGWAVQSPKRNGEFFVDFSGASLLDVTFSAPNYVVIILGDIVDGIYDYAVVSTPNKGSLFVLARNVERFETLYEEEVLRRIAALGFTSTWNRPRRTT